MVCLVQKVKEFFDDVQRGCNADYTPPIEIYNPGIAERNLSNNVLSERTNEWNKRALSLAKERDVFSSKYKPQKTAPYHA